MGPPTTRIQRITLNGYRGAPTAGTVTIQEFSREQRVRRGLAALGKWWGFGLVSVLVPVAHFVLVPFFFFYGVWQLYQALGTAELVADAHGTCPDCGVEQPLELASRWHAPQGVRCKACQRGLRLTTSA